MTIRAPSADKEAADYMRTIFFRGLRIRKVDIAWTTVRRYAPHVIGRRIHSGVDRR
jgi:hypothetical protein